MVMSMGCIFLNMRWPAAPDRRLSPIHAKILALGGQMGCYNGWEEPIGSQKKVMILL